MGLGRDDILKALERGTLALEAAEQLEQSSFPIRGSAIGNCPRQLAKLLEQGPEWIADIGARSARIYQLGRDRGLRHALALREGLQGYTVLEEEPVWTPLGLSGRVAERIMVRSQEEWGPDLPLRYESAQLLVRSRCDVVAVKGTSAHLIEIKTSHSYAYRYREPARYAVQVAVQALGLLHGGYHNVMAHVLIENKNDSEVDVMHVAFSDEIMHEAKAELRKAAEVLIAWEAGDTDSVAAPAAFAPELKRGKGKLPWQCNYCPIGPELGLCVNRDLYELENKAGAGRPAKWEVTRR